MLFSIEGLQRNARLRKTAGYGRIVLNESIESYHKLPSNEDFDIFISYRSLDADVVIELASSFQYDFGYKVYLDRWVDPNLKPFSSNRNTAECIRNQLQHSRCLVYAASANSRTSSWMPWEAGYMDGQNRPVAILPVAQTEKEAYDEAHKGLEYLSLYPYVTKDQAKGRNEEILCINETEIKYCTFDGWLRKGEKPFEHS